MKINSAKDGELVEITRRRMTLPHNLLQQQQQQPQPNGVAGGGTSHSSTSSTTSSGYPSSVASSSAPTNSSFKPHTNNGEVLMATCSSFGRDLLEEHPLQVVVADWPELPWTSNYPRPPEESLPYPQSQMSYTMKTYHGRNRRKDGNGSVANNFPRMSHEKKAQTVEPSAPVFTPGVYQPSSCLRDTDDIYDYVPPRNLPQLGDEQDDCVTEGYGFPSCSNRVRSATLNRLSRPRQFLGNSSSYASRLDTNKPRNGFFYTSPRKSRPGSGNYGPYISSSRSAAGSSLNRRGLLHPSTTSASSSYAISNNNGPDFSTAPVGVDGVNSPHDYATVATSTLSREKTKKKGLPPGRSRTVGCRTLHNLQKLGRRLGLTRFFRTLRIQNEDGSGETTKKHYLSAYSNSNERMGMRSCGKSPMAPNTLQLLESGSAASGHPKMGTSSGLLTLSIDDQYAEVVDNGSFSGVSQFHDCNGFNTGLSVINSTPLSSLPSNERIIETINRLKYQELHRRKERLTQEHRMMLREFKASHNNNGTGINNSSGPSSTFYVPNVPTTTPSSSDYIEGDEISTAIPSQDEEDECCYQEPFDTKPVPIIKDEPSVHLGSHSSVGNTSFAPTTSERPSNESFSETFARHLRRRLSSSKTSKQQQEGRGEYDDERVSLRSPASHEDTSSVTSSGSGSSGSIKDASTFMGPTSSARRSKDDEDLLQRDASGGVSEEATSSSNNGTVPPSNYEGPFKGSAVAMKDFTPSPYDRGALPFKKGDVIQIIATKPTGVWIGKANGQVGHFKFINVRVENLDRSAVVSSSKATKSEREISSSSSSSSSLEERPLTSLTSADVPPSGEDDSLDVFGDIPSDDSSSVIELLQKIRLKKYVILFETEGFETLDLFKDLEPEDLDRLGICEESHRAKLLEAARSLRNLEVEDEQVSSFPQRRISSSTNNSKGSLLEESSASSNSRLFGVQLPYQFEYYKPPNALKFPSEVKAAVEVHSSAFPRDSGVYVGRADEGEDAAFTSGSFLPLETESEEIILSPVNLPTRMTSNSNLLTGETSCVVKGSPSKEDEGLGGVAVDPYEGVRSRFLEHKNFFESVGSNATATGGGSNRNSLSAKGPPQSCEKSNDSGISICANSPSPVTTTRKEYRT